MHALCNNSVWSLSQKKQNSDPCKKQEELIFSIHALPCFDITHCLFHIPLQSLWLRAHTVSNIWKAWDAGADTDLDPCFSVYFDKVVLWRENGEILSNWNARNVHRLSTSLRAMIYGESFEFPFFPDEPLGPYSSLEKKLNPLKECKGWLTGAFSFVDDVCYVLGRELLGAFDFSH